MSGTPLPNRLFSAAGTDGNSSADHPRKRSGGGLPKLYTVEAVAEALDVSSRTVRRWIASGALAVHRLGGAVRIAEADLKAFLALHRDA
jgi:excisionase family DNA binding protein